MPTISQIHQKTFNFQREILTDKGIEVERLINVLMDFQVAIPSWALGAGATRFGRFSIGGEPRNIEEKIEDIALINQLTRCANSVSLHIPWDIPEDTEAIRQFALEKGIAFDSVNSNTFQDYGQKHSYKFGSLSHTKSAVRQQAIDHNKQVIDIGAALGAKVLTLWLADGSSFAGQHNFAKALENTQISLQSIYTHLPIDWKMLIEYKPFEPNFYSMVIPDWGTALLLANACGQRAFTLVDLGHHLPNTNIEQIVATLNWQKRLGGFHFNDSKFADDDVTVGSIKPFQLFLIFNELSKEITSNNNISWMIDASHNLKDPLEDLMQSLENIQIALAKSLLVDQTALSAAQAENDVVHGAQILQDAFETDVRSLVAEARIRAGGELNPILSYRGQNIRRNRIEKRGQNATASGL
ncbi:TIM barrel protein [bacterium]|nr:TIM barrel protein [bacterium]